MGNQEQNKPVSFLLLEEDLRRDIFMMCRLSFNPCAILTMHNIMQMVRHAKIQVKKTHAA